jgi:hypothetical protein
MESRNGYGPHGEIPNHWVQLFQLLNIVEFETTESKAEGYQSENLAFKEKTIRVVGNFERSQIAALCDHDEFIFESKGKAISKDSIQNLKRSLMLIEVTQPQVTRKIYPDKPDKPHVRLEFKYGSHGYDFPVTDPTFLHRYKTNSNLLKGVSPIYLCVSLGIAWEDWHYKLVAGIIS